MLLIISPATLLLYSFRCVTHVYVQQFVNRPRFGHIAFIVDDVATAREAVLAAGGKPVGEIVTLTNAIGKKLTWVYVSDPEGNILELQSQPK
jgi:predicted enzyme related to lactoylglutathione lyase